MGILSVLLTVAIMCVSGLILFSGAGFLMSLFTPSRPAVVLGAQMLRLVALSEPFFGLMVVLEGIFYGLGRTRYSFIVGNGGECGESVFCLRFCV